MKICRVQRVKCRAVKSKKWSCRPVELNKLQCPMLMSIKKTCHMSLSPHKAPKGPCRGVDLRGLGPLHSITDATSVYYQLIGIGLYGDRVKGVRSYARL